MAIGISTSVMVKVRSAAASAPRVPSALPGTTMILTRAPRKSQAARSPLTTTTLRPLAAAAGTHLTLPPPPLHPPPPAAAVPPPAVAAPIVSEPRRSLLAQGPQARAPPARPRYSSPTRLASRLLRRRGRRGSPLVAFRAAGAPALLGSTVVVACREARASVTLALRRLAPAPRGAPTFRPTGLLTVVAALRASPRRTGRARGVAKRL